MSRIDEPGWIAIAVPDGRRGLWYRHGDSAIELCAGREGDDAFVRLPMDGERLLVLLHNVGWSVEFADALARAQRSACARRPSRVSRDYSDLSYLVLEPRWREIPVIDRRYGLWVRQSTDSLELCSGRRGFERHVLVEGVAVADALLRVVCVAGRACELAEQFDADLPDSAPSAPAPQERGGAPSP